jgi:hypothetical protein
MAKPKQQASKTPKKRSTKYSKLAAVCSKELAAKKKALVSAEKALAKATKKHQELLAEVARLDMLDRSLRAVNEGLEPPQNVRYVYTYPQWVWSPGQWNYSYPYNGTYTITLGATQPSTSQFQGGQYSNLNLCTTGSNSVLTTNTAGALTTNAVNCVNTVPSSLSFGDSSVIGYNSSGISSGYALNNSGSIPAAGPTWQTTTTTVSPDLTVDLSTGATETDETQTDEISMEEILGSKKVGSGG